MPPVLSMWDSDGPPLPPRPAGTGTGTGVGRALGRRRGTAGVSNESPDAALVPLSLRPCAEDAAGARRDDEEDEDEVRG